VLTHEFIKIRLPLTGNLHDLVIKTVHLKLKLSYLSFQNTIKICKKDIYTIVKNILSFSQCLNQNECLVL